MAWTKTSPARGDQHQPGAPVIPVIAVLASEDRLDLLSRISRQVIDLRGEEAGRIVQLYGGGLLLIEQGMPGFEQVLLGLALQHSKTAVLVVSDQMSGEMVRALMKLEAWDVLPLDVTETDVVKAIEKLRASLGIHDGVDRKSTNVSQCWAFRGAVGGAGVTTLSIESAFEIARRRGPDEVCLVDLNVSDGMAASFLEAVPKLDLPALFEDPERLDPRLLAAWCWRHESGVSLIAAPRDSEADALASEPAVLRLLDVACSVFPIVIVDMPRHMMPWTKSVLAAVDEAIIVSELTVPSLHAAADMCREIDAIRQSTDSAKLVLNRMFAKKRFRAEFPVERAEKAISRSINATITSDWDAARSAINLGKPVAEVKAKSALVLDVQALVTRLMPDTATDQPKLRHRKGRAA